MVGGKAPEQVAPFARRGCRHAATVVAAREAGHRFEHKRLIALQQTGNTVVQNLAGPRLVRVAAGNADMQAISATSHSFVAPCRRTESGDAVERKGSTADAYPCRGTPPGRKTRVVRWQVSWLADPIASGLPSQASRPVDLGRQLSAYSCGGSRGIGRKAARTAFPFHPPTGKLIGGTITADLKTPRHGPSISRPADPRAWRRPLRQKPPGRVAGRSGARRRWMYSPPPRPWTRRCGCASQPTAPAATQRWTTIEAPHDLPGALALAGSRPALVDCLTLWLTNLMLDARDPETETTRLETALAAREAPTVLVANEVGLGIVPEVAARPRRSGMRRGCCISVWLPAPTGCCS